MHHFSKTPSKNFVWYMSPVVNNSYQKGFFLLYALVVLAALLGGSFVLAQLAMKNLSIVRGAYESTEATFAAETGAECVLYWRLRNGANGAYQCGDDPLQEGQFQAGGITQFIAKYQFDGACVEAHVEVDDANQIIRSRGYNTCNPTPNNPTVVERGYFIIY